MAERRPGRLIKTELSREILSITELRQRYKAVIDELNAGRDRGSKIKYPSYQSFYKYFRNLEKLGLVQCVGDKPVVTKYPGEAGITNPEQMGFVKKEGGDLVVHHGAVQRLWTITAAGAAEEAAWDNPMKALGY